MRRALLLLTLCGCGGTDDTCKAPTGLYRVTYSHEAEKCTILDETVDIAVWMRQGCTSEPVTHGCSTVYDATCPIRLNPYEAEYCVHGPGLGGPPCSPATMSIAGAITFSDDGQTATGTGVDISRTGPVVGKLCAGKFTVTLKRL